ncbi:LysR family transcriptional regulator [Rhodanobacter sp. Root179]|uniref:LysR substrate-binding domain-containing protein n=1 Tax=Rhodanobacter sp. Root179 TaxID=1736482 RepID=UPI0006F30D4B|nr:LysR substrate-binding domain-containing protein [Rhodanobacter sp. Root179]KRB35868.1 LysR family transcriptional regulator [Rhodanobacter sp. Root179]
MPLPNLDMDALRSLVAILRLGGLARAAERIGRSPSAISQQMRKLEAQLGEPLFRKQGRRVVLTEAGDRVHAYAHRILELNDEAVHAVRGAAIEGTVRFGLPGDFAESWLPAALGQFRQAYPAVRVDVLVEPNRRLLERLDRGELDLVLAMNQGARADAEHLATLPMSWIGPKGTGKLVRPDSVLDLALYQPPCFFRQAGTAALDRAGIAWRPAFVTASLHSLWAGVGAGLGITVRTAADLPPTLMRLGPQHGLPPLPGVELCLHTAPGAPSAALARLRQAVMEQAQLHLGRTARKGSGPGDR